jgi:2-amino-4-hydroxy-6-hydroxymethyldihydropteridine diphosphokinase
VNLCYIALGSNQQQPASQLRRAIAALQGTPGCRPGAISPCYRSAAVGPGEQPDYLNAVLELYTQLSPEALLDTLQTIENTQGRVRTERWGPRTLDLDILLYGDLIISTARLEIPHPRMAERNFVLYPLLDIAGPNLMLPDGRELGTLVSACPVGELIRTEVDLASGVE